MVLRDWQDQFEQLQRLQLRLEHIAVGRTGDSLDARIDMQTFLERSESLRDWVIAAVGDSKRAEVLEAVRASRALSIAHDVAIKFKHTRQDSRAWSGSSDTYVVSQSVTVLAPAFLSDDPYQPGPKFGRATHQWTIRMTNPDDGSVVELDVVTLSRDVREDWLSILVSVGLV